VQHTGRECGIVISSIVQRPSRNFATLIAIALFFQVTSAPKKFAASGDFDCLQLR
jgi:hypothetical protein